MLESSVFDLWADTYEEEVDTADENNVYPFAGYRKILTLIYNMITESAPARILDIGIGTGRLSSKLNDAGNDITGVDFSSEMMDKAKSRMPNAKLLQCNFVEGLPSGISNKKYDFIVSTYALHHLTDDLKVSFINNLLELLDEGGQVLIGDIGFPTRKELIGCKDACTPDEWDDDEYYFVFSELCEQLNVFCNATYQQVSHCAGLLKVRKSLLKR